MWRVSLLSLLIATALHAEIRPSFDPDVCAAKATDIVVVTEGKEIDGKVTVVEWWRGELRPGDTLELPELAAFRSQESRQVHPWFFEDTTKLPATVNGNQMVLFLVKREGKWEGAGTDMQTSIVWLEAHSAFAFVQISNPGDAELVRLDQSERELHGLVQKEWYVAR